MAGINEHHFNERHLLLKLQQMQMKEDAWELFLWTGQ